MSFFLIPTPLNCAHTASSGDPRINPQMLLNPRDPRKGVINLFAIAFGIALGGTGTSESPLIARLFGLSSHGLIYGVAALSWTAGSAVGPVVIGYMFDVIGNYQLAFLVCALVGVLGLVLMIMLKPTKRRGMEL